MRRAYLFVLVVAVAAVLSAAVVVVRQRESCEVGRLDEPSELRNLAHAAITAHSRLSATGDLDTATSNDPLASRYRGVLADLWPAQRGYEPPYPALDVLSRTGVEFERFCASVDADTATATAWAHVRLTDDRGQVVTESIEEYRLRFVRRGTAWRLTEFRNPSEFDRDG